MSTQFTLSGIVFEQGTEKRLQDTIVQVEGPQGMVLTASTDECGAFTFAPFLEPVLPEGQTTYPISVYVFNKEGRHQEPVPLVIEVEQGQEMYHERIELINRGPISNRAGLLFLFALIASLLSLAYTYYTLHRPTLRTNQETVNYVLVDRLSESLDKRITADLLELKTFEVDNDSLHVQDSTRMDARVQQVGAAAAVLLDASAIDTAFRALINRHLADVQTAIEGRDKEAIARSLEEIRAYIGQISDFRPTWFWQDIPGSYFEILFWTLFATLIRLIGNTSYYVSRNIFFRDSISHKAALLFTIPIIALIIVFVLSFFKIAISVGETEFVLDFSNPYLLIIVASLIGLAPWRAWEFLYGLADQLFNRLKSWLNLDKKGDEQSEGEETETNQPNGSALPEP